MRGSLVQIQQVSIKVSFIETWASQQFGLRMDEKWAGCFAFRKTWRNRLSGRASCSSARLDHLYPVFSHIIRVSLQTHFEGCVVNDVGIKAGASNEHRLRASLCGEDLLDRVVLLAEAVEIVPTAFVQTPFALFLKVSPTHYNQLKKLYFDFNFN